MTIGAPFFPRFVAAVDPKTSDTETVIVRLYPSRSKPGGTLVLSMVDTDPDEESWFTSSDSLFKYCKPDLEPGGGGNHRVCSIGYPVFSSLRRTIRTAIKYHTPA